MSDSQKQQRPGATPIKNPLLSASVTGLTFDDFPNKPLLLPAAPPIVHKPTTAPGVNVSGLCSRESKSLVIVGSSSSLDTENLDEINLNTTNDDNQTSSVTDPNAYSLLDQSNTGTKADSILSQAASSFSALPAVASNVLSTFSKRLTAISSRETTPVSDQYAQDYNSNSSAPLLDIQPSYTQQSQPEASYSQFPSTFYAPPLAADPLSSTFEAAQINSPAAEPPKFYAPSEVPPIPSISAVPPPTSGGQNNFRFSSKKKLYARIPGLLEQSQISATALDPTNVTTQTPYLTPEVQKPQIQSISLLSKVQKIDISAASQPTGASLTQPIVTDSCQKPSSQPGFYQQNNNFPTPPPATNYFVPQQQTNTAYPSRVTGPGSTPYIQSTVNFAGQQTETSELVNAPPLTQGVLKNSFQTQPSTQIPLFNPTAIQAQIVPGDSVQSGIQPPPIQPTPSNLSSSQQAPPLQPATEQIAFFDPTKFLPPSSQASVANQANTTISALPPSSAYKVAPPTSGQTSYRLQKGTKLYKNPLTPQETAINQIQQPLVSPQSVPLVTPPIGQPPSAPSQTSSSAFFVPSPSSAVESLTTLTNQHVSLFTPFLEETKSIETAQTFPPVSGQTTLPLFVAPCPSNISRQDVSFSTSTLEETKSHATPQSISPAANSQTSVPLYIPAPPLPSATSNPTVPFFSPKTEDETKINETLPASAGTDTTAQEQLSASSAPPIKKLKSSDESALAAPEFTKIDENKSSSDLVTKDEQTRELTVGSEDPLETFDKHFLAHIPKQDSAPDIVDNTETASVVEPIQAVFEPNLTAIREGTTVDPLEETLQKLSITAEETKAAKLPPIGESFNLKNPYRRGSSAEAAKAAPKLPTLAHFFTPEPSAAASSVDLNFFASLPPTQSISNAVNFFTQTGQAKEAKEDKSETIKSEQPDPINFFTKPFSSELAPVEPQTSVHPPVSAFFPAGSVPAILEDTNAIKADLSEPIGQENLVPPRGFENIQQLEPITVTPPDSTADLPSLPPPPPHFTTASIQHENSTQTQQPEIVNRFSIFFNNQTNQQTEIAKDPSAFFDSIPGSQQQRQVEQLQEQQLDGTVSSSVATNEEQRIQYFFNNPPPKDASHVGDLNYDLVHSGLAIKHLQQRSLTPVSNLVEPPSSACSEFSEISNYTAGQKSFAANNLSITEVSDKSFQAQEANKSAAAIEEPVAFGTPENYTKRYGDLPEDVLKELRMADKTTSAPAASVSYKPAVKHWFFKRTVNDKQIWMPFSHYDSALLETSLLMEGDEKCNIVAVEGSRYDVNIKERKKMSVYWESPPIEVRRCSWFYKAVDSKYVPYEEETAEVLENEYRQAAESGVWHKTIILGMGEQVVFHGPTVIVHFQQQQNADAWGGTTQSATRPRVVKRDLDDFNIEQGESQKVDHLLFMVHGIGSACDLKLRSVEEVVEDFRTIARQLVQSHYKNSTDLGLVGRVEVLPISWHSHLHSGEMGIDEKLRMITLESIPKLRNFTNDTLLDILFYTSPTFCQKIMNTIVSSLNTLYLKYRERHPEFNGGVSLAGHSLGSLIMFDLLCHQNPIKESEEKNLENPDQVLAQMDSNQLEDKQMSYTMGPAGTGQPFIHYNQLIFQPKKFFALGSPIGMFVTIRGIDKLGLDFRLPTCPGFYNIFHPYDPVAYRIEALVNPDLSGIRPVLIPHHKGRKRMHLELKETMARVSMDLKNRFLDKFKTTLESVNIFGSSSKSTKEAEELMEKEVDKVIQMQMQLEEQSHHSDNLASGSDCQNDSAIKSRQRTDSLSTAMSDDAIEIDFPLGKLNDSKRIDYVLQEAPLEFINEYIFALSSHVCYWDSEDTILFVMKEIYSGLGISPDSQVPQQTMTIERPSSRNSLIS